MTGLSFPHLNLPGLFEINETGTILYARTGPYEDTGPITDITGRNFFELAGPEIRIELRERIRRFVKSRNQADSFYVTHRLPVGDRRVKVARRTFLRLLQ